jgi:ADP-ribose pyrophosphatase YjhB (NUDIX family)
VVENVLIKVMKNESSVSSGGVVINSLGQILVVKQLGDTWSLPKGHVNEDEDILVAAQREVSEESGVSDLELVKGLGFYYRPRIDKPEEIKKIYMFLFITYCSELLPKDDDNKEAVWLNMAEAVDRLSAKKDKEFLMKVARENNLG